MTPDRDAVAHLRLPRERELRERLYRELARALAGTRDRATVVVEVASDGAPPQLWAAPGALLAPVLATPPFASLRGERAISVPDEIREDRWEVYWRLAPVAAPVPPNPGAPIPAFPERELMLGESGRVEIQTFWLSGRGDGRLWVARRARGSDRTPELVRRLAPAIAGALATEWSRATGTLCAPRAAGRLGKSWGVLSGTGFRRSDWLAIPSALVGRTAEPVLPARAAEGPSEDGHTVVLGSSGAGKSTYLAELAARSIRNGTPVFAIDLHGDLGPAIAARLGPREHEGLVAVDVERRPVVGVAALDGPDPRAAAQFVAAVKRLSPDGAEVYWGFRLERIFDAFVRLAQESGGGLTELYGLLTEPDRREAARLATRDPQLARFLDELGPILRRTPDFLWSAAARLSKVVLVPALGELLAPADGGVPVEELIDAGRSVVVRVPFAAVGPEAAAFAGSLLLARVYLGLAARRRDDGPARPLLVVLDEVQGLAPRLVAEMLAEGRKSGVRLTIATQYPERLAAELRAAAMGVSRGVVAFRVPRASAPLVGSWLGLAPAEAERELAELPVGVGLCRVGGAGELCTVGPQSPPSPDARAPWRASVDRTGAEFVPTAAVPTEEAEPAVERLLLAVLAAEERGSPVPAPRWVDEALELPGPPVDRALLEDRRATLGRRRLVEEGDGAIRLTAAGERALGLRADTGAARESGEHRRLLLSVFRLFARNGHRLEIVRQGRFDTTLPDARFRQLPEPSAGGTPRQLLERLERARDGWAWRCFRGLDVQVEVEVSGATRLDRIRHGLEKARRRGSYALFVVGTAEHAARVRRSLRTLGAGSEVAQVWRLGAGRPSRDGKGGDGSTDGCGSSSRSRSGGATAASVLPSI